MAYENFTTFTKVDPESGTLTQTATRSTWEALFTRQGYGWLYKDYGEGFFGDYIHDLDYKVTFREAWTSKVTFWAVTNSLNASDSLTEGQVLFSRNNDYYDGSNPFRIVLKDAGNGNSAVSDKIFSVNTEYYIRVQRSGTTATCKIYPTANDRINDTNVLATLSITCQNTAFRYILCPTMQTIGTIGLNREWGFVENLDLHLPERIIESDTLSLSDELNISLSLEKFQDSDILTLLDECHIASLLRQFEEDSLSLDDEIAFKIIEKTEQTDLLSLSDEIKLDLSLEKLIEEDSLSLVDAITLWLQEVEDLFNDFRICKQVVDNIDNKFVFVKQTLENIANVISIVSFVCLKNILNKINTKRQEIYNIKNDIRTRKVFQLPSIENAGIQSLGKSYVRVYINAIEQTDVDVDSIFISKGLNGSHTAVFELARPYDSTKPDVESEVEIKYHVWTLYKGYITQINPTDNPEHIQINCQDKYWKNNRENVYFHVGHKPKDNTELYYNTIKEALGILGINFDIGDFIPQTIDVFGSGKSDAITTLVGQAGNFAWYYDISGTPRLWTAGLGDVINLEAQTIGRNLNLYQVLSHNIRNNVEGIVNKYRVQMGEKVIRRFNAQGGTKQFAGYRYAYFQTYASPDWDSSYEVLAKNSVTGYGFDYHKPEDNELYQDVFRKYRLPFLNPSLEQWTDRYPPEVRIRQTFYGWWSIPINEGFTIDYENRLLIFNQPLYFYRTNQNGELIAIRRPIVELRLWKKQYYSYTENPTENPEEDVSNPLMFFTDKMGNYPQTIIKDLNLPHLSIQEGGQYTDSEGNIHLIPSWDDTDFAKDYANWQLSQNCDEKISGTIEITLDAFCYYGIDLTKRIMINGILVSPLNIENITINLSSFTVTLQLHNRRYYKRSQSIPSRGE